MTEYNSSCKMSTSVINQSYLEERAENSNLSENGAYGRTANGLSEDRAEDSCYGQKNGSGYEVGRSPSPPIITKESIIVERHPVIASNVSVPGAPLITKSDDSLEQQRVIQCLSSQMMTNDDSQDESLELKQNEQTCTEEESSVESLQMPSERIILHSTKSNYRSSPSSVTAPVICMGPSSNLVSPYDIPRGQGLPPVSTIIRSTSMARYDRSTLHHTHLQSHHHSSESIESTQSIRFSPHRSVVVSTSLLTRSLEVENSRLIQHTSSPSPPSPKESPLLSAFEEGHLPKELEGTEMNEEPQKFMDQMYVDNLKDYASCMTGSHSRITPEMAEMINCMVSRGGVLREEEEDDLMTEIPESSIHSAPSGLIISPNRNLQRLIINNCTSVSSDETSEGSSPLLSVEDSDMDCKVQDLTHASKKPHPIMEGVRIVQGIPRGVITSAMSSMQMSSPPGDLKVNKSPAMDIPAELLDEAAEDLSHSNKMQMDGTLIEEEEESTHNTTLPSFLSSLSGSSLASLSASLLPLGLATTSATSFVESQSSPITSIISVSTNNVMSNVKQEAMRNSCLTSGTVTSLYSSLPQMQNVSHFIKQELPSPSSGSLPPFPVISSAKRDHHSRSVLTQSGAHPIMSVVQTTPSFNQLPSYNSMRLNALPPLNIPSSSSDSPASSPMTAPSEVSPLSLSPAKKNDKMLGMGHTSGALNMVSSSMINNLGKDKEEAARKWCCIMCRNGSPCGLHPTHLVHPMGAGGTGGHTGAMLSGDPSKPYQCGICGKNLASKNVFQLHMRSHSGEKPFRCNLCGHHFSQKTSLTRHMRSHTGERPFPCSVCGKRFADKERIKIHMRTHTGEKPFACEVCGKRFSQKSTVKRHMSVHTGEKPFKCEACGKGFANRGNLNAHAKTHANS